MPRPKYRDIWHKLFCHSRRKQVRPWLLWGYQHYRMRKAVWPAMLLRSNGHTWRWKPGEINRRRYWRAKYWESPHEQRDYR